MSPGPVIGILVAVVVIFGLILWLAGYLPKEEAPPVVTDAVPETHPGQVQFTDLVLSPSPAQEVTGVAAMYVQGLVINTGQTPVNTIVTEVVLRDRQGEVAQHETHPLTVLSEDEPTPQEVPLEAEPLQPNQSRPFRITLQRVPPQWNKELPEIHVVSVTSSVEHGEAGVEVTPETAGEAEPPGVAQPAPEDRPQPPQGEPQRR